MLQPELRDQAVQSRHDGPADHDGGIVEAFAAKVRELAEGERRGELAELRRIDPDQPVTPSFFRILAELAPDAGREEMRRYARLLRILALKPLGLVPINLGSALARARISEARVQKLLSARGAAVADQLELLARQLANDSVLPYRDIGRLLLASEDDEETEPLRLKIARAYWRAIDLRAASNS